MDAGHANELACIYDSPDLFSLRVKERLNATTGVITHLFQTALGLHNTSIHLSLRGGWGGGGGEQRSLIQ